MSLELPRMGHEVTVCPDGLTAAAALSAIPTIAFWWISTCRGCTGIEVIARAKELSPHTEAVVLTGKSSLETAIAALRQGAFDYLTKPCKLIELKRCSARVAEKRELTNKYLALKRQLERIEGKGQLIGDIAGMDQVGKLIAKVAPTDSTVLILGETGTGKELVARAVHDQSLRADMPFVAINCGRLPESLIESELFGHRAGPSPGPTNTASGCSKSPTAGRFSSTRSASCPRRCRPSCCGSWRAAKSAASAKTSLHRRRARGLRDASQPGGDGRRGRFSRRL